MRTEKSKPELTEGAENVLTDKIIGAAIEVHRHLGPGLLESIYEECLCYELCQLGLQFERQVHLPITYKGLKLSSAYKMDLLVEDTIVVEIKATEEAPPIQKSQLLTYLKSANKRVGLLINFNVPVLKFGLKRVVNHYAGPALADHVSAPSGFALKDETPLPSLPAPPRLRASASNAPRGSRPPSALADHVSAPSAFAPEDETTPQPLSEPPRIPPRLRVSASKEPALTKDPR
jgi:GxxExxY protein